MPFKRIFCAVGLLWGIACSDETRARIGPHDEVRSLTVANS